MPTAQVEASVAPGVLVVDDEPAICSAIRIILELEGYRVLTAGDGQAALAQVAAAHPRVVLLDLRMPGLDGWQTYARLQQLAPTLPVVVMSAGERLRQHTAARQAAGVLAKPFDVDGVLDTVARFIPAPAP